MNEYRKLMESLDTIKAKDSKLEEGRVFNNTREMLRSMLNDVRRVQGEISGGMAGLEDVEEDLNDIVQYYMDAEIKQQRY